jgi:hypothetical protein
MACSCPTTGIDLVIVKAHEQTSVMECPKISKNTPDPTIREGISIHDLHPSHPKRLSVCNAKIITPSRSQILSPISKARSIVLLVRRILLVRIVLVQSHLLEHVDELTTRNMVVSGFLFLFYHFALIPMSRRGLNRIIGRGRRIVVVLLLHLDRSSCGIVLRGTLLLQLAFFTDHLIWACPIRWSLLACVRRRVKVGAVLR